jgi:flagellar basal body-associated protein FliL
MDKIEIKPIDNVKRKLSKKIVVPIILVMAILVISGGILIYSKVSGKTIGELTQRFAPEKSEHTLVLNEFLVNLNSGITPTSTVLRINIAIKYIDEKNTEVMKAEIPMIRDIILTHLMELQVETILEDKTIEDFKNRTRDSINLHLDDEIATQVYVTDMIIR